MLSLLVQCLQTRALRHLTALLAGWDATRKANTCHGRIPEAIVNVQAATSIGLQPGARVIPATPDEPHVAAARSALHMARQLGAPLKGLPR